MSIKKLRAGGLVINNKSEILLIFRKGKWDLPKGKVEKKEKNSLGAMRETSEETGLRVNELRIKKSLIITTHLLKGRQVKTKWYLLKYKGINNKLKPQKKEGIETCKWVNEASLIYYTPHLRNYARDVFDFYFSEIRNLAS